MNNEKARAKRLASHLKKEGLASLSHCQALDAIAAEEGFANWQTLLAQPPGTPENKFQQAIKGLFAHAFMSPACYDSEGKGQAAYKEAVETAKALLHPQASQPKSDHETNWVVQHEFDTHPTFIVFKPDDDVEEIVLPISIPADIRLKIATGIARQMNELMPNGPKITKTAELEPKVTARIRTDDHVFEIENFDVTQEIADLNDTELLHLAECGEFSGGPFGGDTESDRIAEAAANRSRQVTELFAYLEQVRKKDKEIGFECYIDEAQICAWIREHRPAAWAQIVEQVGTRLDDPQPSAWLQRLWNLIGEPTNETNRKNLLKEGFHLHQIEDLEREKKALSKLGYQPE